MADLTAFRDARNAGQSVAQWQDSEGVINIYADIDASSIDNWKPITFISNIETLEGNGHTISGLKITYAAETSEYVHSLSFIDSNAGHIKNLTIEGWFSFQEQGSDVRSRLFVAGFCRSNSGTIFNCTSDVDMVETFYQENSRAYGAGGIVCDNQRKGLIENCTNKGDITVVGDGKGIVAGNNNGTVRSCKNYGNISYIGVPNGDGISIAGIAGCWQEGIVEDCINYGTIDAKDIPYAGGISGGIYGIVRGCVNEGEIISSWYSNRIGGIAGSCYKGASIVDCTNKGHVHNTVANAPSCGGIVGHLFDETTYENNVNNGMVNGASGTEDNAIGEDERAYSNPGIYSLDDLVAFRDAKNSGLSITKWKDSNGVINIYADIDASSIVNWKPISSIASDEIIEGNGHTLSGLNYTEYWYKGDRWGFVQTNDGVIRNLNVSANISIRDKQKDENGGVYVTTVGVIAVSSGGEITSCQVTANNAVYPGSFGGIVGYNYGKLQDCVTRGKVGGYVGPMLCGGICITNNDTIDGCTNYAYIRSEQFDVAGGIVCYQDENGIITNCVNEGDVIYRGLTAFRGLGGIVGWQMNVSEIKGCTNNASIDGFEYRYGHVGGIVGQGKNDGTSTEEEPTRSITDCKNSGKIFGYGYVGNICGSLGGANSTMTGCTYGGTVNGSPGTEANAIGYDVRYE